MAVPHQIISAKNSQPCMAPVQDTVIGSYILSSMDTFLPRHKFFDLTMQVSTTDREIPPPAIMYRDENGKWQSLYTGKQLINYLMPKDLYFSKAVRGFTPEDRADACMDTEERFVTVYDGDILSGRVCKATLGTAARGLIHRIHYKHGAWRAAEFISDIQKLISVWFVGRGFSIGMADCVPSAETTEKVSEVISRSIAAIHEGTRKAREAGVSEERIEGERSRVAGNIMTNSARVVLSNVPKTNSILQCVESGAKGKKLNITQILGCKYFYSVSGCCKIVF